MNSTPLIDMAATAEKKAFAKLRMLYSPALARLMAMRRADGASHNITQLRRMGQLLHCAQQPKCTNPLDLRNQIGYPAAGQRKLTRDGVRGR